MSEKVTPKFTEYVVGFLFSRDVKEIVLIRKERPDWQKGKLNGPGGAVQKEDSFIGASAETPLEAMYREFDEETGWDQDGLPDEALQWKKFAEIGAAKWKVHFFWALGSVERAQTVTDEAIERHQVDNLPPDVIPGLTWLVPLALDSMRIEGGPISVQVKYKK